MLVKVGLGVVPSDGLDGVASRAPAAPPVTALDVRGQAFSRGRRASAPRRDAVGRTWIVRE